MHYKGLVITYNGEIYNYRELREGLEEQGSTFCSSSDTEVLLQLIRRDGIDAALEQCHGMFALGVYDQTTQELHLARDRFGEKPLYYGVFRGGLVFASELPALRKHPFVPFEISEEALLGYFRHNCVTQPNSIIKGVRQVRPGHIRTFRFRQNKLDYRVRCFWNPTGLWSRGENRAAIREKHDVVREFVETARKSVARQMVADVPIGAFLSGGVDSSLVVALMQSVSSIPVQSFTVGFEEDKFNEAGFARKVAQYLGTNHTEVILSSREAQDQVPNLSGVYGEPFADSSQLPTMLVSAVTRRHVTVALTGDGADEFFGGYPRYLSAERSWEAINRWPARMLGRLWRMAEFVPDFAWTAISSCFGERLDIGKGKGASTRMSDRLAMYNSKTFPQHYIDGVSFWRNPDRLVMGNSSERSGGGDLAKLYEDATDRARWMMFRDTQTYLTDDILTKVDRASMSVSLETRAPFLDKDLAQFAWQVPTDIHFADRKGKWILREALKGFVPKALVEREKMGFAIPLGDWLRADLRDWAEALLTGSGLRQGGWLDSDQVEARWRYHLRGDDRYALALWSVLMFQSWLECQ